MCGIAGYISDIAFNENEIAKTIHHRGPDELGFSKVKNATILNTRLSIIDVAHGQQPFISEDENIHVVQNGEIYNFVEIKEELEGEGIVFNTNSDTEVILRAYIKWGEEFILRLNGMFAIAIIDKVKNKLLLYRDRLGVKPLFYTEKPNGFFFSSELKTFAALKDLNLSLDKESLYKFLIYNYIPVPNTIYKNVFHVMPGEFVQIDLDTLDMSKKIYWDLKNQQEEEIEEEDLMNKIDDLLIDATKIRLRSDVPIATFLSGGLDSSMICAIMHKLTNKSFDTFSIGFDDKRFDESPYAKEVSGLFSLNNILTIMKDDDVELWDKVTFYNDQPHGDISFVPTYVVSREAAKKYKVVLTGDGGDEAFGGYEKYRDSLKYKVEDEKYFHSISLFHESSEIFKRLLNKEFHHLIDNKTGFNDYLNRMSKFSKFDNINKAIAFDVKNLLPGNNLVKPDRMGMANSLEARSPMLDYRLYDLMFKTAGQYKLSEDGETKSTLKKLALKYLPKDIVYRKKQMFTVPIGEWFKDRKSDELKLLSKSERLINLGMFDMKVLQEMIEDHVSSKKNYTRELRAIMNIDIWLKAFKYE
ncbi:asparagine synthase (glutamine-hydrolyzing) [Halobacteriovorax sp. RT-2-6]|uniref:asparagine synthase (glutamine-hydrolyzing) n=1 Tax=unclassified Halobacteriovorax TaxID=2639665 RepID=UPI00399A2FE0